MPVFLNLIRMTVTTDLNMPMPKKVRSLTKKILLHSFVSYRKSGTGTMALNAVVKDVDADISLDMVKKNIVKLLTTKPFLTTAQTVIQI